MFPSLRVKDVFQALNFDTQDFIPGARSEWGLGHDWQWHL